MTTIHVKHLPASERRAATVKTVVELAATRDPGDITTTAIARHMQLTQGALFRHFPSKEAIWEAVLEWVAERLLARVDYAARTAASPLGALEAVFMSHAEFVTEHPGVPRMMFGELQRPGVSPAKQIAQTLMRHYREHLQAIIKQGKACGELPATLDDGAAITLFIGTIQGLVMQSLLVGDVQRIRREAAGVFAIYERGIRAGNTPA